MGIGKRTSPLGAGAAAPGFRLRKLEGGETTLVDLVAGGPVLLAFFKVSCPVCQLTLPFLDRIQGAVRVVGISQDEADATRDFSARWGIRFPVLLDTGKNDYQASNDYGLTHVPTLFVVEPDGTISRTVEGFVKADLEALGSRAGVALFKPGEYAPEWKAG